MRTTIEILDKAKGINSDYWLAHQIGVKPNTVSMWRKRRHIGPDAIIRLCELAKIPVAKGLAVCAWETVTDPELRERVAKAVSFRTPYGAKKGTPHARTIGGLRARRG